MPKLTIARANAVYHCLVNDAQIEGKLSVTPKWWLWRNNRKTYHNTFAASAVLAYGQPSQEAPKKYTWPTNWWIIFMYFLEHWLKSVLFRYLDNSMQNQARSTDRSGRDRLVGHPCHRTLNVDSCAIKPNVKHFHAMLTLCLSSMNFFTSWLFFSLSLLFFSVIGMVLSFRITFAFSIHCFVWLCSISDFSLHKKKRFVNAQSNAQ